ncbi:hypothetical protein [Brachybacterium sp. GPGPB12]|uniref:hypothetical protein n=1 Tax=Brachybacterium sp. GPGPB12 TaxID=3023517 RepID=UPI00313434D2
MSAPVSMPRTRCRSATQNVASSVTPSKGSPSRWRTGELAPSAPISHRARTRIGSSGPSSGASTPSSADGSAVKETRPSL